MSSLLKLCLRNLAWPSPDKANRHLVAARTDRCSSSHYSGTRRVAALYVTLAATATIERCE